MLKYCGSVVKEYENIGKINQAVPLNYEIFKSVFQRQYSRVLFKGMMIERKGASICKLFTSLQFYNDSLYHTF